MKTILLFSLCLAALALSATTFALTTEDIAASQFSISDSALDTTGEVPVPGTTIHQIHLMDFVPKELMSK